MKRAQRRANLVPYCRVLLICGSSFKTGSARKHSSLVRDSLYVPANILCGVPQGYILDLTLFSLYMLRLEKQLRTGTKSVLTAMQMKLKYRLH